MNKLKITLILLQFILLQINIHATIRYVKAGNPTPIPPYTSWATASDSIQKCITVCVPGDTICIGNGIYKERVVLKSGLSFIGSGIDSCVIDTRDVPISSGNNYSLVVKDSCYVTGFKIYVSKQNDNIGVYYYKSSSPPIQGIFENNMIINASIGISMINTKILVKNNFLINCYKGIDYDRGLPIIKENYLSDISGYGIAAAIDGRAIILNNIIKSKYGSQSFTGFFRSLSSGNVLKNNLILGSHNGYEGVDSYKDTVHNNIISGGYGRSFFLMGGSDVRNNIITWGKLALRINTPNSDSIKYNNIWDIPVISQGGDVDSTNITKYPMFADPDNNDYHLQKYSPMIDAGDPYIIDLDGTRSDLGAYGGVDGEIYAYSDLPPRPPRGLKIARIGTSITISWIKNFESDFHHYSVYMDSVSGFLPAIINLIDTLSLSDSLTITVPPKFSKLYFKITATDNQGNTSLPSEEAFIILTDVKEREAAYQEYTLFENYPEPFTSSTIIAYVLKEEGYVKLSIYDILGNLVATLVNEAQGVGYHEIIFNPKSPKSENQNVLSSGIYIYRIDIIGKNNIPVYSMTKKMIKIK